MTFEHFSIGVGVALLILMIPAILRIVLGPSILDRIVGANVIGTMATVLLVIIGIVFEKVDMFIDFALAYALLNFTGAIAAARYLHRKGHRVSKETQTPEPTEGKEVTSQS